MGHFEYLYGMMLNWQLSVRLMTVQDDHLILTVRFNCSVKQESSRTASVRTVTCNRSKQFVLFSFKVNCLYCNSLFTSLKNLHKTVIEGVQRSCIYFGVYIILDVFSTLKSSSFDSCFHLGE